MATDITDHSMTCELWAHIEQQDVDLWVRGHAVSHAHPELTSQWTTSALAELLR